MSGILGTKTDDLVLGSHFPSLTHQLTLYSHISPANSASLAFTILVLIKDSFFLLISNNGLLVIPQIIAYL